MPNTSYKKSLYRVILIGAIIPLLLFACSKAPDAQEFHAPSVGKATIIGSSAYSVTLQAPILFSTESSSALQNMECGFYILPDNSSSTPKQIAASINGKSFSATAGDLAIGTSYTCTPYICNGGFEVRGQSCKISLDNPFEDEIFWKYIISNFDSDGDEALSQNESESVTAISVTDMGITSLEGIELFPQLMHLYCQNNRLRKLDLSRNIYLTELAAERNMLEELDLRQNKELRTIVVWENHLTKIDVAGLEMVGTFWCWMNRLNEIDISSMKSLINFGCAQNAIKELDLSNNTKLINLCPNDTFIKELDLSNCPDLESLEIQGNNLMTEVDLTCCPKIRFLRTDNCPNLKYIYLKQGQTISELYIDPHTTLIERQ